MLEKKTIVADLKLTESLPKDSPLSAIASAVSVSIYTATDLSTHMIPLCDTQF